MVADRSHTAPPDANIQMAPPYVDGRTAIMQGHLQLMDQFLKTRRRSTAVPDRHRRRNWLQTRIQAPIQPSVRPVQAPTAPALPAMAPPIFAPPEPTLAAVAEPTW